jgi:hypothetical protein
MNSLFNNRSNADGKVGFGKLPNDLLGSVDDIANEYSKNLPDKNKTTYHTYFTNLNENIRQKCETISNNDIWKQLCDNNKNAKIMTIQEMNELYYSNVKCIKNSNLYGAAANILPHRDCVIYNFYGINVYRVIIGLTDNNSVITNLINFNISHKIQKGEYILFDFDKTLHNITKSNDTECSSRILMKIHFIVCENGEYPDYIIHFIKQFYIYYYLIARWSEQIGTDPTTFLGFFHGLLWQYPFEDHFKTAFCISSATSFVLINTGLQIKFTNYGEFAFYFISILFALHLFNTSFFYFRYVLYGYK